MSGAQAPGCCCHFVGGLSYRPFDQIVGPQILYPASMPTGTWTDEVGGGNPWNSINDPAGSPDDDTTYMQSIVPAGTSNFVLGVFNLTLPSQTPDGSQVHRITIRAKKLSGFCNIRVRLMAGATLYATLPETSITTSYVDYTYTLTPAEIASLPSTYALQAEIRARNEFTVETIPRVTQMYFEC